MSEVESAPPSIPRSTPPTTGLAYHQLHRGGHAGWIRPLLGVPVLLILTFVIAPALLVGLVALGAAVTGHEVQATVTKAFDTANITPFSLAMINVILASAIPLAWLMNRMLHGIPARFLASVGPRIRWGWLLRCLGLAVLALVATLFVSALLPSQGDGTELTGALNDWTRTTRDFVLVIVLLTPLQAAGEEYAFRGYLTQAFGGAFRSPWVAVVIPALIFGLFHGLGQSLPIFFDRFAFGIVAGILAIATGGLEAAIAMHVLNNFLAYGLALAYGDMTSALNPTGGSWWSVPVTLTQSLVYLALVLWAVRRHRLRTVTDRAVLVGSGTPV